MPLRTSRAIALLALLALVAVAGPAVAAPPIDPRERNEVAGQPAAVEVFPTAVNLSGTHDASQLVVTGKYADGTVRDLTAVATARVEPADVVEVHDGLFLRPKKNGSASLVIAT